MLLIDNWLKENLKKDFIILEAGTADGTDTANFCELVPDGFVYGFEPLQSLYNITQEKIKNYNNVLIEKLALGEKTGTQKFYVSDRFDEVWGSSSLFEPNNSVWCHPAITFKDEVEVKVINLDEWLNYKKINHIDLMWLDMQGAEPSVLRNSPNSLSMTKYLYSEVSKIELYKDTELYPSFKKFLEDNNFQVVFEDIPWEDAGNVLFKNLSLND